ncbi:MAG: hypothetical protein ACE5K4_00245 [Candidatus Hydrothermarchaeota archaeon]
MDLIQRLRDFKNKELGMIGGGVRVNYLNTERGNINSDIDYRWNIKIDINPEWRINPAVKEYLLTQGLDPGDIFFIVSRDLLIHESFHWKYNLEYNGRKLNGCPTDIIYHSDILGSVTKALKLRGMEGAQGYIASAFEDLVANTLAKLLYPPYAGQVIFYYDRALINKGFDPFSEALVKLNIRSWGVERDRLLLKEFFSNDKIIDDVIDKITRELGITESIEDNARALSYKKDWPYKSYTFAYHMATLIDEKFEQITMGPESSFEKMMDIPRVKKDLVLKVYMRSKKPSDDVREIPEHMDKFEFLDLLYDALSSRIFIKAEGTGEGFGYPVMKYCFKKFEKDKDDPERIVFRRLVPDPDSPFRQMIKRPINFQVPRFDYSLTIPAKSGFGRMPDFCFIIDTSGSMQEDVEGVSIVQVGDESKYQELILKRESIVEWGDDSKYHHALLGLYGIIKYIQSYGIAPYVRYNLINFSDKTLKTGWKTYSRISEIKKLALTPQFGNTIIDIDIVKTELGGGGNIIIMLSDGQIHNWQKIKSEFIDVAKKNYLSFIEVETESKTGYDLKEAGFDVNHVRNRKDLLKLMIDLTKQGIRKF